MRAVTISLNDDAFCKKGGRGDLVVSVGSPALLRQLVRTITLLGINDIGSWQPHHPVFGGQPSVTTLVSDTLNKALAWLHLPHSASQADQYLC